MRKVAFILTLAALAVLPLAAQRNRADEAGPPMEGERK
jgi:hypothetical protein